MKKCQYILLHYWQIFWWNQLVFIQVVSYVGLNDGYILPQSPTENKQNTPLSMELNFTEIKWIKGHKMQFPISWFKTTEWTHQICIFLQCLAGFIPCTVDKYCNTGQWMYKEIQAMTLHLSCALTYTWKKNAKVVVITEKKISKYCSPSNWTISCIYKFICLFQHLY